MSFRKLLIAVIVTVVVLIGAVVGYIAVDRSKQQEEDKEAQEAASLNLFTFDSDSITSVDVTNDDGHFLVTYTDGTWVLTETDYPHELRVNPYYFNNVCSYLSHLTADKKVDVPAERLADYGLADPAVLTASDGLKQYTLLIGSASATKESYYVMLPDSDAVFAVDYTTGELLRGGASYVKSIYMIEDVDVYINDILLTREGGTVFDIAKRDGLWEMEAPLKGAVLDGSQITSLLNYLTRTYYNGFPGYEEDGLAQYGLDKPYAELTVSTDEGTTQLLFSKPSADGSGDVYVLDTALGQIGTITASDAGFLNTDVSEILYSKLLSCQFTDTASLTARVDDLEFTMEMDHAAKQYLFNGEPIDTADSNLTATYKNLFDTVPNIEYDTIDIDPDLPEEPEPACEFTITDLSGAKTVLTLVPIDDTTYWAYRDGQYTGLTVRRRALSSNTGVLNYYEKLTDLLNEQ